MYRVLILFALSHSAASARILAVVPTPLYSHQTVFHPIWRALSLRGHQVTLLTTNPLADPALLNLTEIDLSFTHKLVYEDHQMQNVLNSQNNIWTLMNLVFSIVNNMTVEQLEHPGVKELIRSDKKFDLVIVEAHVPAWFAFSKKYNCSVIMLSSMPATNFWRRVMGNMYNPVFTPSFNLPFDHAPSFWQRVVCVVFEIYEELLHTYWFYPEQQKIIRHALADPEIDFFDILKRVPLIFVNEIPGFHVSTTIPSVIQLNGLQIKPPQTIPKDLKRYLDEASQGVIYFSLGSNIKSYLLSEEKKAILLDVFKQLPFRVLWKFEDKVDRLPANVKVVAWAPQQDILRHKNTKLFITQGGLQSIDEAVRFKVPILGFPFFADQFYNTLSVKRLQLGSFLDFNTITTGSLKEVILGIIDNATYLANLEELADLLDPPMSSLEKALWWIEYVIRHGGAQHLRSPLADIPVYKYYLLDVIFVLILCVAILVLILLGVVRLFRKAMLLKRKTE